MNSSYVALEVSCIVENRRMYPSPRLCAAPKRCVSESYILAGPLTGDAKCRISHDVANISEADADAEAVCRTKEVTGWNFLVAHEEKIELLPKVY